MKILKNQIVVIILTLFFLFFTSCEKYDLPHFWETMGGIWKVGNYYSINGNQFEFSEYDKNFSRIVFKSDISENNLGEYNTFTSYDGDIFSIINNNGLYDKKNKMNLSEVSNMIFCCPDNYKIDNIGYPIVTRMDTRSYSKFFFKESSGCHNENCEDRYNFHLQLDELDYVSLSGYVLMFINEYTGSSLSLEFHRPFYGRKLDGKYINDTIQFSITRTNESDIFDIPAFDPKSEGRYFWDDMDSFSGLKGNASDGYEALNGDGLYLPDKNSFAIFDEKIDQLPITLSFWINPENVTRDKQIIYSKYKNKYGPFIFSLVKNKFLMEFNNGNGTMKNFYSSKLIKQNKWNHICISVDENNFAILYINGEVDSNGTIPSPLYDATGNILLGRTDEQWSDNNNSQNFIGGMDEFIGFRSVLNSAQISQLYDWHLDQ